MSSQFDLFVVGTGSAGTTVAERCRKAGWTVGIADSRPFGGTCAQRGCDPKKVLVGAADLADAANRYHALDVVRPAATLNWPALMQFKRTFTDPVPDHIQSWMTSIGVTTFHGAVRFTGDQSLMVGDTEVHADRILIATGAVPVPLGFPGAKWLDNSESFLEWDRLPAHVIFIGGGYISLEFAHIARSAGAAVTVLHRGPQILAGFDPDLVERLRAYSVSKGIDIHLNTEVTGVERQGNRVLVHAVESGHPRIFEADAAVHGAGRVANLTDLELEKAHVPSTPRGVTVNSLLQSVGNPAVYAAGDAADTPGLALTPVAVMEGHFLARHLLGENPPALNYHAIPTMVYTNPAMARVGMQEQEAREKGYRLAVHHADTTSWYSSRRVMAPVAEFKVLVDEDTDAIVGAHVLGPHAEEVINLISLAMRSGITASALRSHPFAYPTGASDLAYMV